jgi:hypothetical protein
LASPPWRSPALHSAAIDDAKERFKAAWLAFKDKVGAYALAKAYAEMSHANRSDRYRR